MTDILDLGGRVALVTGAGPGVGRQVAPAAGQVCPVNGGFSVAL